MDFTGLLTAVVFLPLAGAVLIALVARSDRNVRLIAGAVALAELVLSAVIFARGGLRTTDPSGRENQKLLVSV